MIVVPTITAKLNGWSSKRILVPASKRQVTGYPGAYLRRVGPFLSSFPERRFFVYFLKWPVFPVLFLFKGRETADPLDSSLEPCALVSSFFGHEKGS